MILVRPLVIVTGGRLAWPGAQSRPRRGPHQDAARLAASSMQSTGTRPPARRCCRADDVQTDGKHTRRAASPTSAGGRHRQHCRLCLRPDRIGGSVFLAPTLIAFAWASARDAAAISPPFILCNSTLGLLGAPFGRAEDCLLGVVLFCCRCRRRNRRLGNRPALDVRTHDAIRFDPHPRVCRAAHVFR